MHRERGWPLIHHDNNERRKHYRFQDGLYWSQLTVPIQKKPFIPSNYTTELGAEWIYENDYFGKNNQKRRIIWVWSHESKIIWKIVPLNIFIFIDIMKINILYKYDEIFDIVYS